MTATVAMAAVAGILVALPGPLPIDDPGDRTALITAIFVALGIACIRHAKGQRRRDHAEIRSERERIACDLHDGLAQDLVCIAAQGQRLDCRLDPDHPLTVASRHALARVRGVIADLAASTAPTTEAALRLVSDQLGHRFGLQVDVWIEGEPEDRLDLAQRDDLIRAAREAIVNAALHAGARHVDLVLNRAGALRVLVCDDAPRH